MATETLDVSSVGNYDDWYLQAGADKVVAVNQPDDNDTSYLRVTGTPPKRQSFLLEASAIPVGSTINSVTVYARCESWDYPDSPMFLFLRLGSTDNDAADIAPGYMTWANYNNTIGRPGGGSWTLSDLATLEVGVGFGAGDAPGGCSTTLYAVIDYTEGGGGPTGNMLLMFT